MVAWSPRGIWLWWLSLLGLLSISDSIEAIRGDGVCIGGGELESWEGIFRIYSLITGGGVAEGPRPSAGTSEPHTLFKTLFILVFMGAL